MSIQDEHVTCRTAPSDPPPPPSGYLPWSHAHPMQPSHRADSSATSASASSTAPSPSPFSYSNPAHSSSSSIVSLATMANSSAVFVLPKPILDTEGDGSASPAVPADIAAVARNPSRGSHDHETQVERGSDETVEHRASASWSPASNDGGSSTPLAESRPGSSSSPSSSVGAEDQPELLPPDNFAMVSSFLYRSSFPGPRNFAFLRTLGLKSVLTLVLEDYPQENRDFLNEEGIRLFQVGIPGNKSPIVQIPDEKIVEALKIVFDVRNHPMLIHCNKGKHRTGCLVGCIRKAQEWPADAIAEEYRRYSFPKSRSIDAQYIESFARLPEVWDMCELIHLPPWLSRHEARDLHHACADPSESIYKTYADSSAKRKRKAEAAAAAAAAAASGIDGNTAELANATAEEEAKKALESDLLGRLSPPPMPPPQPAAAPPPTCAERSNRAIDDVPGLTEKQMCPLGAAATESRLD